MLTKEEQQILVSVSGQAEVEKLTALYRANEKTLIDTVEAYKQGTITQSNYTAMVKLTTGDMIAHQKVIDATRKTYRDYQMNILGAGYALNDFFSVQGSVQQRLNAIANNMPMLLSGFGQWGLALGAILPIAGALIPVLHELAKAMGFEGAPKVFDSTVEMLQARIKEFEKTPIKTSIQIAGFEEAKKALADFQRDLAHFRSLEESRTKIQDEAKAGLEGVLKEGTGKDVAGKLKDKAARDIEENDPAIKGAQGRKEKLLADAKEADEKAKYFAAINPEGAALYEDKAQTLRNEAAAVEEAARKRSVAIRARDGDAERRVGAKLDAAKKGDMEPLAGAFEAVGRKDLARQTRESSPAAVVKKQQEAARVAAEDAASQQQRAENAEAGQLAAKRIDAQGGQRLRQAGIDAQAKGGDAEAIRSAIVAMATTIGTELKIDGDSIRNAATQLGKELTKQIPGLAEGKKREAEAERTEEHGRRTVREARQNEADRDTLQKDLGNDFLGAAESDLIDIKQTPATPKRRAALMKKQMAQVQAKARKRLLEAGHRPDRVNAMVNQLPTVLDEDVRTQRARARAAGFRGSDKDLLEWVKDNPRPAGQGPAPLIPGAMPAAIGPPDRVAQAHADNAVGRAANGQAVGRPAGAMEAFQAREAQMKAQVQAMQQELATIYGMIGGGGQVSAAQTQMMWNNVQQARMNAYYSNLGGGY